MPKTRAQLVINTRPAIDMGSPADSPSIVVDFAPPALPQPLAPSNLQLTTATEFSTASPSARVTATWDAPPGVQVRSYIAQISESNTFPAVGTLTLFARGDEESIDFSGRRPGITQYVRVAAVAQTQGPYTAAVSIAAALDVTPAAQPTALAGAWIGTGDLQITWTNPDITISKNFRDVELKIFASNGGAQLGPTINSATGRYLFTAAMNLQYTSGVGDPSLYIEARSRTWSDVVNNVSPLTLSTTKSAPAAPTVAHSWTGDAGLAGADLKLSWTPIADAAYYLLSLNGGTAQRLSATIYTYTLAANIADNTTADPTITYSLKAVDGLGQLSTDVSGTATNAAPPPESVVLTAGFSALSIVIDQSDAADFKEYQIRVQKDAVDVATYKSTAPDVMIKTSGRGVYQVFVTVVDAFGQLSTETSSLTVFIDAVTNEEIRADAIYTDSIGTDFTTATNKIILKDDATGAGITYAASAVAYRWTQLERPLIERGRRVSLKLGSNTCFFYIATSIDGTTWRWFANVGVDGYSLTEYASEALAAAAAEVNTNLLYGWAELPSTVEFRFVKLYHRNTTLSYRLDEFYAYTLVVADMIRAGDIQGIHIAAATIAADKITATFTITGKNIQTATSGARVVLSGDTNGGMIGYSASDTYNTSTGAGTYQLRWSRVDGKLYAGAGSTVIDEDGISLLMSAGFTDVNTVKWRVGSTSVGMVYVLDHAATQAMWVLNNAQTSKHGEIYIQSQAFGTNKSSSIHLNAQTLGSGSISVDIIADTTSRRMLIDNTEYVHMEGGLNVGSGVTLTAADGAIRAAATITSEQAISVDLTDAVTNTVSGTMSTIHRSTGTPAAGFGSAYSFVAETHNHTARTQAQIYAEWTDATDATRQGRLRIIAVDNVGGREVLRAGANGTNGILGFFGAAGVFRPSITGVSSGTPTAAQMATVIRNIIAALAVGSLGLVTDNTT